MNRKQPIARAKEFPNPGLLEERYKVCGKLGPVPHRFTPNLPFQLDPGSPDSENHSAPLLKQNLLREAR